MNALHRSTLLAFLLFVLVLGCSSRLAVNSVFDPIGHEHVARFEPLRDPLACALYVLLSAPGAAPATDQRPSPRSPQGRLLVSLIAWEYLTIDSLEAAISVAEVSGEPQLPIQILSAVAAREFRSGRRAEANRLLERARRRVETFREAGERASAWISIARAHFAAGSPDTALALLNRAMLLGGSDDQTWNSVMNTAAWGLSEHGEIGEALARTQRLRDRYGHARASLQSEIAISLAAGNRLEEARRAASAIPDTGAHWQPSLRAHRAIALAAARSRSVLAALSERDRFPNFPLARAEIGFAVADWADSAGLIGLSDSLLHESLAAAFEAPLPRNGEAKRSVLLVRLSGLLARHGHVDTALRAARAIPLGDPITENGRSHRSRALSAIGVALVRKGERGRAEPILREASTVAEEFNDRSRTSIFHSVLAGDLDRIGARALANEYRNRALFVARELEPEDRAYALYWCAGRACRVAPFQRSLLFLMGYEACREIRDPDSQARMLLYLGGTQLRERVPFHPRVSSVLREIVRRRQWERRLWAEGLDRPAEGLP